MSFLLTIRNSENNLKNSKLFCSYHLLKFVSVSLFSGLTAADKLTSLGNNSIEHLYWV